MTESSSPSCIEDIKEFYDTLACIEDRAGGCRTLAECNGTLTSKCVPLPPLTTRLSRIKSCLLTKRIYLING